MSERDIPMPKQKSKRALRKRVRLTGKGRLRRHRAYKSHILTKKHPKRKRHLRRSEEHTSELQSPCNLVCRLLLEKKSSHRLCAVRVIPAIRQFADHTRRRRGS